MKANEFKNVRKKKLLIETKALLQKHTTESEIQYVERLMEYLFFKTQDRDLLGIKSEDCYGAVLCLWRFIQKRTDEQFFVRAYNPNPEEHYWYSHHSVVEILVKDMPFLVASILMELDRQEICFHRLHHPIIHVKRNNQGQLIDLLSPHYVYEKNSTIDEAWQSEALIQIEIDRRATQAELDKVVAGMQTVIRDVLHVNSDWKPMLSKLDEAIKCYTQQPQPIQEDEVSEVVNFLQWLKKDNFLFVGYRYYELVDCGDHWNSQICCGSGLGTFRDEFRKVPLIETLSDYLIKKLKAHDALIITKSYSRSTVQRPAHLDYVGIKHFNDHGNIVGFWCFFGLFASQAYSIPLEQFPIVRKKVEEIFLYETSPAISHRGKALKHVINAFPRDELLQSTQEDLNETIIGILDCQELRQLRVFLRKDIYDRFITAMVYVPKDYFNTELRFKLQQILLEYVDGTSIDTNVKIAEYPLVQLHFTIHCNEPHKLQLNTTELEKLMVEAMLRWHDHLHFAILEHFGEAKGSRLYRKYVNAFPASYREEVTPRHAVADIARFEKLSNSTNIETTLYNPVDDKEYWHFRVVGKGKLLALSDVLPILDTMGVKVYSAHPYSIDLKNDSGWVLNFSIAPFSQLDVWNREKREQFQDVFVKTCQGELENDHFNALVVTAGLNWREIILLRALAKYLLQMQVPFSQSYMEEVLNNNPKIVGQLVNYFSTRFDPDFEGDREKIASSISERINNLLDEVLNLDEDRILRHFLSIIEAMLRTNAYQLTDDNAPKPCLSFKFAPALIPAAPQPRPKFEIFVYSPVVEGIHMRADKIARGGLRWSDRREDFRTEILGLVKAQMIKNSIIVPHGAKGGFVPKQLNPREDREAILQEGIKSYRLFISAMLDLTDNLDKGQVVPPKRVVRYDDDDPYLVVAADKGTATFSDIANEISLDYGFWLGDAFASGGSYGYDHKKMGITAKGAWESVKRLFVERDMDIQNQDFTVVGIGDMSGDVFGNGMLLSKHIRLLAAFNHLHIFIDPDPDIEKSFEARKTLYEKPRSSWDDYDRTAISKGGSVYSRQAKKIRLSPQACEVLDIDKAVLTPAELIQYLLKAPVDLLWNGGIGTYVKSSQETHEEVGDKTNDVLRIDAEQLRVKVVGEGGNLGFTQLARIEFAKRGGLINTDAVDNSAGVDTSDHEVNLKILLGHAIANGDMTLKQRNQLLQNMTDEVSKLVLRHNYLQSQRLSLSNYLSFQLYGLHKQLIKKYEDEGRINRDLDCLPSNAELKERYSKEEGLSRPELAVLLSYSKLLLKEELVNEAVEQDEDLFKKIYDYFPSKIRDQYADLVIEHPLKSGILATHLTNIVFNSMGAGFIVYLKQMTYCSYLDAVRAFFAVIAIQQITSLWNDIEHLTLKVNNVIKNQELAGIQRQIEKSCIWILKQHAKGLSISKLVDNYYAGVNDTVNNLDNLLGENDLLWLKEKKETLIEKGFSEDLANRCVALRYSYFALNVVDIANRTNKPVATVAEIYFALEDHLKLHWLRQQIRSLPIADAWQRKAQASLSEQIDKVLGDHCAQILNQEFSENNIETAQVSNAEEALQAWLTKNDKDLNYWMVSLENIKSASEPSLAMLSVAVQDLGCMIH